MCPRAGGKHCGFPCTAPFNDSQHKRSTSSASTPFRSPRRGKKQARCRPRLGGSAVTPDDMPPSLAPHFDWHMAEGVGWKLLPLQVFPGRHELALDNDCILWAQPPALKEFWHARALH